MEDKSLTDRVLNNSSFRKICGKISSEKILESAGGHLNKNRFNLTNKDLVDFYNYIEQNKSGVSRYIEIIGRPYGKGSQRVLKEYLKTRRFWRSFTFLLIWFKTGILFWK